MLRDVSLDQDLMSDLALQAFEGTNVNLRGLRFGSEGGQAFYGSMIEPRPVEKSAVAVQFYSLPGIAQILFVSGTVANLIAPQYFARSLGRREPDAHLRTSLAWMAFTREALKDSRPMTDWERKAAADFFWSETFSGQNSIDGP